MNTKGFNPRTSSSFADVADEALVFSDPNTNNPTNVIDNSRGYKGGSVSFLGVPSACDFKLLGNNGSFWVSLYEYSFTDAAASFSFPIQYISSFPYLAVVVNGLGEETTIDSIVVSVVKDVT